MLCFKWLLDLQTLLDMPTLAWLDEALQKVGALHPGFVKNKQIEVQVLRISLGVWPLAA